MKILVCLTL